MDDDIYFVCRRARWGTPWPSRCTALSLTGSCSGPITLCSTTRTWRTSQRWNLSIPRGRSESQGCPPLPSPPASPHVDACASVRACVWNIWADGVEFPISSCYPTPPLRSCAPLRAHVCVVFPRHWRHVDHVNVGRCRLRLVSSLLFLPPHKTNHDTVSAVSCEGEIKGFPLKKEPAVYWRSEESRTGS